MQLVISEKPSVAQSIAKVLGADKRMDGYMEGNSYRVSWCIGHLVALYDAGEYDEKYVRWYYDDLPIVPEHWQHKVLPGTKKQFDILKKLMHSSDTDTVICATDAGREGELIFRLVYEQAGCEKPVKRLWISSMEESAIAKGFEELKDGSDYDALYASALCRSEADWLVGINGSRLFSVLYNKRLSVGRVQTPTLAMIVAQDQKVKGFKKEKYYVTHLKFGYLDAVSEHFATRTEAEAVAEACSGRRCSVQETDRQQKIVKSPKLYDLTTLQRECNRLFGYTAQETLDCTQKLYEKKLVTYPRTDSRYLTDEMAESTGNLISLMYQELPFADQTAMKTEVEKVLNSKKVSDHHAIIPTKEATADKIRDLPEKEKNVFYAIAAKLLTATAEDHVCTQLKYEAVCEGHVFHKTTTAVLHMGFKQIEQDFHILLTHKRPEEADQYADCGTNMGPVMTRMEEAYTTPPKQYTEDTLLSAMERAGNEALNEETEKKGIGTPATRAAVIEKLISAGLVRREKKMLIPSDDGVALITVLPEDIKSPKMTAEWELCLTHIAQRKASPEQFMTNITGMVRELVERYHEVSEEESRRFANRQAKEQIGICPRCSSPVYEGQLNFYCSDRKCSFALWKNNRYFEKLGKKLDKKMAVKLLKDKQVLCKNLVSSKNRKHYTAMIHMEEPSEGYVSFHMTFPEKTDQTKSRGKKNEK